MPVPSSPNVDLLLKLQESIDRAKAHREAQPVTETRTSICDHRGCGQTIAITITVGQQRWSDVEWQHTEPRPNTRHRAVPELRIACDATCPGCKYPEIGFAPARDEFVCSRCGHTQTERPKD